MGFFSSGMLGKWDTEGETVMDTRFLVGHNAPREGMNMMDLRSTRSNQIGVDKD